MVKRLENGDFDVNGTIIKAVDAYLISQEIDTANHETDAIGVIAETFDIDEDTVSEKISKDVLDEVIRIYEKASSNNDSWRTDMEYAVSENRENIEKDLSAS